MWKSLAMNEFLFQNAVLKIKPKMQPFISQKWTFCESGVTATPP